jgi:hypothetical protein
MSGSRSLAADEAIAASYNLGKFRIPPFYSLYKEWKQAFELAAQNGAVSFH